MLHKKIELHGNGSCGAFLTTYFIESNSEIKDRKRPIVIICPGGAYMSISCREGEPIALRFLAEGYHAAVLNYSIYPSATYPTALLELGKAIKMLRENAEEWLIDTNKIIVVGFSAGGHLAASYSCFWSGDVANMLEYDAEILRPNGLILGYPVITSGKYASRYSFANLLGEKYDDLIGKMSLENQVNDNNPPTFIWHTETDEAVPVENSKLFTKALENVGILVELHLYPEGKHGLALANEVTALDDSQIVPSCQDWFEKAIAWMKRIIINET